MGWCGVALALREPGDDALGSRIPTYLHPLAGRSLAWHALRTMAALEPPTSPLLLVGPPTMDPGITAELPAKLVHADPPGSWWAGVADRLGECGRILVLDAAAAGLMEGLAVVLRQQGACALRTPDGQVLGLWLDAGEAAERCPGTADLAAMATGLPDARGIPAEEAFVVRDRAALARAAAVIRRRLIARHMAAGVTFLAPDGVLVDVDVTIGADTVIYPSVVLEGTTSIGAETVVGPGCRIVDAQVGSGVELKGWNYIVRSRIRNRAVLEPYVRRGFD